MPEEQCAPSRDRCLSHTYYIQGNMTTGKAKINKKPPTLVEQWVQCAKETKNLTNPRTAGDLRCGIRTHSQMSYFCAKKTHQCPRHGQQ